MTTPKFSWPTGPVIEPKSAETLRQPALKDEKDVVRDALDELDEIVRIAGGFPGQPAANADPAAAELFAPPPGSPARSSQASDDPYPDQPADLAVDASPPPLDTAAERAAWSTLLALINAHKDPGTIVTAADPDTFMSGLE
ncbi:MAG TPA: hypothetical protein PK264_01900 [Hyphomicrobiaceae bacterium]|nr:hypothetical protein [Hyphomicrobiaceae bacterium]